jgi:transcriptional regulator with PAS, ATPase and Fis domain
MSVAFRKSSETQKLKMGDLMKTKFITLQILDPSGHRRSFKLREFPFRLGTNLEKKESLRDPEISNEALQIEMREHCFVLKSLQEGLMICLGDLKMQAMEIPLQVPLKVADTEIVFSALESRVEQSLEHESAWHTESESGAELLRVLKRVSETQLSIYLSGDTGTGKEVLAKQIHAWSNRVSGPFVPINCGALPLSLVESELFGHVKGAFTGAVRDRPGAFLQAHNGTLFLDEVGDLPAEIQVKILRFLESGEIRPVGSDRVLHADVRIVCATHKPLAKLVQEGKFRQDLYFRLASVPIEIPNLRSRPEDIRALGQKFAAEYNKTLTAEAIQRLQANAWPGNVRELRHAIERAAGFVGSSETILHAQEFDFLIHQTSFDAPGSEMIAADLSLPGVCSLKEMEKILILRALKLAKGNRADAAKILGVARSTLFEMIKRHQIVGPKSTDYWMEFSAKRVQLPSK